MSSTKQSRSRKQSKSAINNTYSDRIKTLESNLLNGGVSTGLIDEYRRLSIELFNDAVKHESTVNELNARIKKHRKDTSVVRPKNGYALFCDSARDKAKMDFIASSPHVFEDVMDETTKIVTKVEKIEYTDSKGIKKRCAVTGVPVTVLQPILSAMWGALSVEDKSPFIEKASALKADAVAKLAELKASGNATDTSGASVSAEVPDSPVATEAPMTCGTSGTCGAPNKRKSNKGAKSVVASPDVPAPVVVSPDVPAPVVASPDVPVPVVASPDVPAPAPASSKKRNNKKVVEQPVALTPQ